LKAILLMRMFHMYARAYLNTPRHDWYKRQWLEWEIKSYLPLGKSYMEKCRIIADKKFGRYAA
jgi:hypothetical protein